MLRARPRACLWSSARVWRRFAAGAPRGTSALWGRHRGVVPRRGRLRRGASVAVQGVRVPQHLSERSFEARSIGVVWRLLHKAVRKDSVRRTVMGDGSRSIAHDGRISSDLWDEIRPLRAIDRDPSSQLVRFRIFSGPLVQQPHGNTNRPRFARAPARKRHPRRGTTLRQRRRNAFSPSLKRKSRSGRHPLFLEGDGVAEAFELGDEASGGAGGVAAGVVVAAGIGVGLAGLQHVPDGDEQRVGDRE